MTFHGKDVASPITAFMSEVGIKVIAMGKTNQRCHRRFLYRSILEHVLRHSVGSDAMSADVRAGSDIPRRGQSHTSPACITVIATMNNRLKHLRMHRPGASATHGGSDSCAQRFDAGLGRNGTEGDRSWEDRTSPDPRSSNGGALQSGLRRTCHWLFIKGGMAPVFLVGLILLAVVARILEFR